MKNLKRIWILLMVITLLTSVVSGIIWSYHGRPMYEEAKMNIEKITSSMQTMKDDLKVIKLTKADFKAQSIYFDNGNKEIKYYDESDRELLIEYYDNNGHIVKTECDTNRDGKKDVFEHDPEGDGILNTVEHDIDGNGKIDVIERDTNRDGIIETTEIEIGIEGKFVPLGPFGNIIM